MDYIDRNILPVVIEKIRQEQIVVLTGARQTGKTTLCERLLPRQSSLSYNYLSFDDPDERLRFQDAGITILESMAAPLTILDEVQKIPILFEQLKYVADKQKRLENNKKNSFILTGSSQLILLKNIKETLAGRAALLHLYPFSLAEVLKTNNPSLLTKLWLKPKIGKEDKMYFDMLSAEKSRTVIQIRNEHQKWGGYPPVWQRTDSADKIKWLKDYKSTYVERDLSDVGQVASIDNFVLVQKLLCARTGQLLSLSEVSRDLSLAVNTVKRYLTLLTLTFQCHLVSPYYQNIGKRLIKSPKIYFPDAGLNRVILGEMSTDSGAAYESWVFSELIKWKQLQRVEPELFFYRTSGGLEIDFLLVGDGFILPIEAKASEKVTYADGRNLELFMAENKKKASLGLVVYRGRTLTEIRKNIWAVPDWFLVGGI